MRSNKNLHAVLAIDPGGTTGIAAGYMELENTRRSTLEGMYNKKSAEVKGNYLEQAVALDNIFRHFIFTANVEHGIPQPNIHVAIEDFVLRRRTEGGATGNLTSVWVAAAFAGILCKHFTLVDDSDVVEALTVMDDEPAKAITWQTASDAKHVANDERLKSYGLWVVGSAHERDAFRHLVLRVDKLLSGVWLNQV
jgi:hypothetical protein